MWSLDIICIFAVALPNSVGVNKIGRFTDVSITVSAAKETLN
jgi:hypothetical protein